MGQGFSHRWGWHVPGMINFLGLVGSNACPISIIHVSEWWCWWRGNHPKCGLCWWERSLSSCWLLLWRYTGTSIFILLTTRGFLTKFFGTAFTADFSKVPFLPNCLPMLSTMARFLRYFTTVWGNILHRLYCFGYRYTPCFPFQLL